MGSNYCDGLESWKSVDIEIKIVYEEDLRVFDGFASGSNIEQCQMVEWLPSAHQRGLQSPSAAESPKQDRCERPSAKHSEDTATVTAGAVARAGSSERMRGTSRRNLQ